MRTDSRPRCPFALFRGEEGEYPMGIIMLQYGKLASSDDVCSIFLHHDTNAHATRYTGVGIEYIGGCRPDVSGTI